jgi:hypothetical protein
MRRDPLRGVAAAGVGRLREVRRIAATTGTGDAAEHAADPAGKALQPGCTFSIYATSTTAWSRT